MQEQDGRDVLVQQLTDLGEQVKVLAGQLAGPGRVSAERLADLQSTVAQLTDTANELQHYVDTLDGQT